MLTKIEMEFYNTLIANTKKQTEIYKEILEEIQNLTTDINLINKLNRKLGITEEEIMARQNEQEILKQL